MSEVVVSPAPVAQITNFQLDVLVCKWSSLVHVLFLLLLFQLILIQIFLFASIIILNFSWKISIKYELPIGLELVVGVGLLLARRQVWQTV